MKLHLFALRDAKVASYLTPFFAMSIGHAMRSISDEANRSAVDNILFNHPGDFELFHFGEFDSETGFLALFPSPQSLVVVSNLRVTSS